MDCCPSLLHLYSHSSCVGGGGVILPLRLKWIKSISSRCQESFWPQVLRPIAALVTLLADDS